jgi:hypothetical protein
MSDFPAYRAMPAWGDAEISRFLYRVNLFKRRGVAEPRAEKLADALAVRDYERDPRRLCLECAGLQRGAPAYGNAPPNPPRCGPAAGKRLKFCTSRYEPVTQILQRCEAFTFQKP